eukprot:SAG11_NODE_315_length_10858_cov_14.578977_8_plen_124_part_00
MLDKEDIDASKAAALFHEALALCDDNDSDHAADAHAGLLRCYIHVGEKKLGAAVAETLQSQQMQQHRHRPCVAKALAMFSVNGLSSIDEISSDLEAAATGGDLTVSKNECLSRFHPLHSAVSS